MPASGYPAWAIAGYISARKRRFCSCVIVLLYNGAKLIRTHIKSTLYDVSLIGRFRAKSILLKKGPLMSSVNSTQQD